MYGRIQIQNTWYVFQDLLYIVYIDLLIFCINRQTVSTGIHQMCWRINWGRFPSGQKLSDSHGANVTAFSILLNENDGDKHNFFTFPEADFKTNVWYDTVHIMKNIRNNNLLNRKKFVFPAFNFELNGDCIVSEVGYICWSDLHKICDIDVTMDGNLRKARETHLSVFASRQQETKCELDLEHIWRDNYCCFQVLLS